MNLIMIKLLVFIQCLGICAGFAYIQVVVAKISSVKYESGWTALAELYFAIFITACLMWLAVFPYI